MIHKNFFLSKISCHSRFKAPPIGEDVYLICTYIWCFQWTTMVYICLYIISVMSCCKYSYFWHRKNWPLVMSADILTFCTFLVIPRGGRGRLTNSLMLSDNCTHLVVSYNNFTLQHLTIINYAVVEAQDIQTIHLFLFWLIFIFLTFCYSTFKVGKRIIFFHLILCVHCKRLYFRQFGKLKSDFIILIALWTYCLLRTNILSNAAL